MVFVQMIRQLKLGLDIIRELRMHKRILAGLLITIGLVLPFTTVLATTDPAWTGEYYSNKDLSGDPVLVRQDPFVNMDWRDESPDPSIPADNFSVRWTRKADFESWVYIFGARADDGFRAYVDGKLVLDRWSSQKNLWSTVEVEMTQGEHIIVFEYYEGLWDAQIEAGYWPKEENVTSTPGPTNTATAGPSPTPTATRTPTATATSSPTSPFIVGTPGASAGESSAPPSFENGVIVREIDSKFFSWDGFPGPAIWTGGQDGRFGYVKNRANKPTFEARWNFISHEGGYYDMYVFIPTSGRATTNAEYTIVSGRGPIGPIVVNQATSGSQWVRLGTSYFAPGEVQYIHLDNATGEADASHEVLFDSALFVFKP
jgi:hypothetical protein